MRIWHWSRRYPQEDEYTSALARENVETVTAILQKRGAPVDAWFVPSDKLHGVGQGPHVEYTGLLWAARQNNMSLLAALLQAGAKVNAQLQGRDAEVPYTALHIAALHGFMEVATALVRAGADVNLCVTKSRASFGALLGAGNISSSPLHIACLNGQLSVLQVLLQHPSIDVNKPAGVKGLRPIHCAIQSRSPEVLSALLSKKPDLELTITTSSSPFPVTALQYAMAHFAPTETSDDEFSDSCTSLSDTPASCRCSPRHASSPARLPCPSIVLSDMVDLLLQYGANLHVRDSAGNTVLHQAVILGCSGLVDVLLRRGALSLEINHLGKSAWITALECKNDSVINLLMKYRRSGDGRRRHSVGVHLSRGSLASEAGVSEAAVDCMNTPRAMNHHQHQGDIHADDTSSGSSSCSDCPVPPCPTVCLSLDGNVDRSTAKVHTC